MAQPTRGLDRDEEAQARPRSADESLPLAEAKLAAPALRAGNVDRPRLVSALDAGAGAALTLVAAPAGYGKSTAVRGWCESRNVPLAWVTLDLGDNDPVRFWRYVATAIDRVRQGLGRRALQRLAVAEVAIEESIDELMNGIATYPGELIVVIDDLQAVTDEDCLGSLDHALQRVASNVRLVAITRSDPAIGLARLRARGALAELRANELAFTLSEAQELLVERGGISLEMREIEVLREHTEGWPAALYLAALWLRTVDDPVSAVHEFGGGHRFVADYLSDEVLRALDPNSRAFVLQAAVLRQFTPALCDGILDRNDSAAVLEELERSNLLVRRLERGDWYTIHSLFAEYCALQLASQDSRAPSRIHVEAARWLRSRGMPVQAVEHAHAGDDQELVAEILVDFHLVLHRNGNTRTLLRWVRTLPDEVVVAYPVLAAIAASAAMTLGRSALERRRFLRLAARAQSEYPERFTPYVAAVVEMVRAGSIDGDVGKAVRSGARAVALADTDADEALVAALAAYARALYLAGELEDASSAAMRAVEHPDAERRPGGYAHARSTLAFVAVDRKQLTSARQHAEAAKSIAGRSGLSRSWIGANAGAALGVVQAAEGQLAAAERALSAAEQFLRDDVAAVDRTWILVQLAGVRCRRGRLDEASATLHAAREAISELADAGRVSSLADDVERELEQARARAGSGELLEPPSDAELAVLRRLTSDLTTREIAAELYLSPNTIRSHMRAIYRKLGVGSRADAVARAETEGLIGETESPM